MSDEPIQSGMPIATPEHSACRSCHAPVAPDQRYCLSCGARQHEPRVPFAELLAHRGAGAGSAGEQRVRLPPLEGELRDWTPLVALGGLALLALVLVVGVLIGRDSGGSGKQAPAPVITLAGAAGTGTAGTGTAAPAGAPATGPATPGVATSPATSSSPTPTTVPNAIREDWPAGRSGFAVQLQSLAATTATSGVVAAAKSSARAAGAPSVGVVNAADHGLGSGYIIYSGIYPTSKLANGWLTRLRTKFPAAKVIYGRSGSSSGGTAPNTPR